MAYERVMMTLNSLKNDWFLGEYWGGKYYFLLNAAFNRYGDKNALDNSLSLGRYLLHTDENKKIRHVLRATILSNVLFKNASLDSSRSIFEQLKILPLPAIKQRFLWSFPVFIDNGNRSAWNEINFTSIDSLSVFKRDVDWSKQIIPSYKILVHALVINKLDRNLLTSPITTMSKWSAISTSILSDSKPKVYSNHGLMLGVPQNNILTTSPSDQWFDNYAGTNKSVKSPKKTMGEHISDKTIRHQGLLTPDEVILHQGCQSAEDYHSGTAITEHNEIVVCGIPDISLPHGITGKLRLLGVYLQTKMDGSLPDKYNKSQGSSQEVMMDVVECSYNCQVPIFYFPTPYL